MRIDPKYSQVFKIEQKPSKTKGGGATTILQATLKRNPNLIISAGENDALCWEMERFFQSEKLIADKIGIRPILTEADFEQIYPLFAEQAGDDGLNLDDSKIAWRLARDHNYRLFGWFDGKFLGMIGVMDLYDPTITRKALRINNLYVLSEYRLSNPLIAFGLTKWVVELAQNENALAMVTEVALANSRLTQVYEKYGFLKTAYYLIKERT